MINGVQVDRNDAYDAFKCFAAVRNWFFVLFLLIPLLLMQGGFWWVNLGQLDPALKASTDLSETAKVEGLKETDNAEADTVSMEKTTGDAAADDEQASAGKSGVADTMASVLQVLYTLFMHIVPFAAVVYCLTLLIGMKLTLIGRLGAMADTAKAFFLSMFVMALVMPWPNVVGFDHTGVLFGYDDLVQEYTLAGTAEGNMLGQVGYYVRFTGVWFLVIVLLIMAQVRSCRSLKTIRQRIIGLPETPEPEVAKSEAPSTTETTSENFEQVDTFRPAPPESSTPPVGPIPGAYDIREPENDKE